MAGNVRNNVDILPPSHSRVSVAQRASERCANEETAHHVIITFPGVEQAIDRETSTAAEPHFLLHNYRAVEKQKYPSAAVQLW